MDRCKVILHAFQLFLIALQRNVALPMQCIKNTIHSYVYRLTNCIVTTSGPCDDSDF